MVPVLLIVIILILAPWLIFPIFIGIFAAAETAFKILVVAVPVIIGIGILGFFVRRANAMADDSLRPRVVFGDAYTRFDKEPIQEGRGSVRPAIESPTTIAEKKLLEDVLVGKSKQEADRIISLNRLPSEIPGTVRVERSSPVESWVHRTGKITLIEKSQREMLLDLPNGKTRKYKKRSAAIDAIRNYCNRS